MPTIKETEKLEHELTIITTIGSKFDDSLERKRNEAWYAAGGSNVAKELLELHEGFLKKTKEALIEEVKKGSMTSQAAQSAFVYLTKSNELIEKFARERSAIHHMKLGEVTALESGVKLLKKMHDEAEVKKTLVDKIETPADEVKSPESTTESKPEEVVVETSVEEAKKPAGRRRRPDEAGHVVDTVKRLKESRKNKK